MRTTHSWRSWLALSIGFIECVLFGGTVIGWSSLVYVLKQEGIFKFLCVNTTLNTATPTQAAVPYVDITNAPEVGSTTDVAVSTNLTISSLDSCSAEDNMLSLAFTIALALVGLLAIPLGWVFDHFGLRYTRLLGTFLAVSGYSMVAFTGYDGTGWLIFPGIALIALSCVTIIMTNCHICLLAGRQTFTCVAIYNGAINTGVVVFLLLKILHDVGFSYKYFMLCLCGLELSLVITTTLTLLPKFKVDPEAYVNKTTTPEIARMIRSSLMMLSPFVTPQAMVNLPTPKQLQLENQTIPAIAHNNGNGKQSAIDTSPSYEEPMNLPGFNERQLTAKEKTLKQHLLSVYFMAFLFWYTVLYVRIQMFVVSFNAWITDLMDGDVKRVSHFTNVLGYSQLACVIVAPFAGIYMDKKRRQISRSGEYWSGESRAERALSCVPSLTVASLSAILLSVLMLIPTEVAIYMSLVMAEIFRAFLYATAIAFIGIMFPGSQYGRLFGVSYLVSGMVVFLQYPLFLWAEGHEGGFLQVNLLLLALVILSLVHPLICWCRHHQHKSSTALK